MNEPLSVITAKHGFGIVEPYIVQIGQTGFATDRSRDVKTPLTTIVSKNEHCMVNAKLAPCIMCNNENNAGASVETPLPAITTGSRNFVAAPTLIQYHSETSRNEVRGQDIKKPIMTLDASNRYGLVTSFLSKYYDGGYKGTGADVRKPLPTVTAVDHNSLCAATLIQMNNHCDGRDISAPLPTITAGDGHFGEVRAFLIKLWTIEFERYDGEMRERMRYEGQCRLLKYECLDCHKAFIVGKELIRENNVVCPYCASKYVELTVGPPDDDDVLYDELGCMSISNINGNSEKNDGLSRF